MGCFAATAVQNLQVVLWRNLIGKVASNRLEAECDVVEVAAA
jgi:hypothetical protein